MAMVAIPISQDISRLFHGVELGENVSRDPSDHITLFYLGDELKLSKIIKMIPVIFEITSKMGPFEITCSRITTFSKGPKGYPIIAEIKSKELTELRNKIKEAFEEKKIKYDDKWPEFKPHITLGFSKKKIKNKPLDKATWGVNALSIYGGDHADTKLFVNFPFNLGKTDVKKISEGLLRDSNKLALAKEKYDIKQIKKIPRHVQLKIINALKKKVKKNEIVQKMYEDYGVDIDELDLVPMGFADLDVSARTDHGVIWLNYNMLQDGSFLNDDHYLVHELTHVLQQTTGDGPTTGGKDDYLDNKYEQEGFQNQTEYIADTQGEDAAEDYIDQVMDKHEVPNAEREEKRDVLLGV